MPVKSASETSFCDLLPKRSCDLTLVGRAVAFAILSAFLVLPAHAREVDCRYNQLFPNVADANRGRSVIIVVDKTVRFPPTTIDNFVNWSMGAIHDGDDVEIVSFSANTINQSPNVDLSVHVRQALTDDEVNEHYSTFFADAARMCRHREITQTRLMIRSKLQMLATNPVANNIRSEIVETLSKIPQMPQGARPGHDPLIIIASDMIENASPGDSFYRIENLEADRLKQYLEKERAYNYVGHMRGARVFVIGAATIVDDKFIPSPAAQSNLKAFWCSWFGAAGARLAGWGNGALFEDAHKIDAPENLNDNTCN